MVTHLGSKVVVSNLDQRPPVGLSPPVQDLAVLLHLDPPVQSLRVLLLVGLRPPGQGLRLHCRQLVLTLTDILLILDFLQMVYRLCGCAPWWLLQWLLSMTHLQHHPARDLQSFAMWFCL